MATHQEIAGVTDEELVNRMISSHGDRFDDMFWNYFSETIDPHLSPVPTMIDIGCGPGLLLRDLRSRYANAILHGYDVTAAMIEYADNEVDYEGDEPGFHIHDITDEEIPLGDGCVDLVSMVAVLHVLPEPIPVLQKVARVLKPGGVFLLQDWIRTPLPAYLDRMTGDAPPERAEAVRSAMYRLFPAHNKYTTEDWLWVLEQAGFSVINHQQLRSPHFCAFVCKVNNID